MKQIDYRIDSLYVTRTYGGCLEGAPPAEAMIESAKNHIQKMWGKRSTLIIEPALKEIPVRRSPALDEFPKMLPQYQHAVWVNSFAPISKDADGSELVIIWWDDNIGSTDNIHSIMENVEWNKHAADFWY